MKEFKGTQGKWEVDPYADTLIRSTNSDNGTIAECKDGTHWGNDENVKRANARLIAAAPELLKALQGMLLIVNDSNGVAGYHMNGNIAEWDEFREIERAEKIINEALGINE